MSHILEKVARKGPGMSDMGDKYRYQMQLPRSQATNRPAAPEKTVETENGSISLWSPKTGSSPMLGSTQC